MEKNPICRQTPSWLSYHSETMPEAEKWLSNALRGLIHVSIYDRQAAYNLGTDRLCKRRTNKKCKKGKD